MKYLFIILDGVQDISYPELAGKTPLEAGWGEGLERFERESAFVTLSTTPPGMEADTLNCVLTLLGLEAPLIPSGRSYLESLAEDIFVGEEDIILRCSFVEVDGNGVVKDPCCTPPADIAAAIMRAVAKKHGEALRRVGPYKCMQVLEGVKDELEGLVTHAAHGCKGLIYEEALPSGNKLADALAETGRELLKAFAPYTVIYWAPSRREELPSFTELTGLRGGFVQKTSLLGGIARLMEMPSPQVPGATGECDTNLLGKAQAALSLLSSCDMAVVHVGGADEATHRQSPEEKAGFIARVDKELLLPIMRDCPDGCKILLTSDHEALCSTAGHTDAPVGGRLWEKGRTHGGDLGLLNGREAISLLTGGEW
ncbi:MAG: hypothetical protein LBU86_02535 [Oscillospiraceae bacterium]|nr:hypothetical protein [Oscillospiraceae bacterium]